MEAVSVQIPTKSEELNEEYVKNLLQGMKDKHRGAVLKSRKLEYHSTTISEKVENENVYYNKNYNEVKRIKEKQEINVENREDGHSHDVENFGQVRVPENLNRISEDYTKQVLHDIKQKSKVDEDLYKSFAITNISSPIDDIIQKIQEQRSGLGSSDESTERNIANDTHLESAEKEYLSKEGNEIQTKKQHSKRSEGKVIQSTDVQSPSGSEDNKKVSKVNVELNPTDAVKSTKMDNWSTIDQTIEKTPEESYPTNETKNLPADGLSKQVLEQETKKNVEERINEKDEYIHYISENSNLDSDDTSDALVNTNGSPSEEVHDVPIGASNSESIAETTQYEAVPVHEDPVIGNNDEDTKIEVYANKSLDTSELNANVSQSRSVQKNFDGAEAKATILSSSKIDTTRLDVTSTLSDELKAVENIWKTDDQEMIITCHHKDIPKTGNTSAMEISEELKEVEDIWNSDGNESKDKVEDDQTKADEDIRRIDNTKNDSGIGEVEQKQKRHRRNNSNMSEKTFTKKKLTLACVNSVAFEMILSEDILYPVTEVNSQESERDNIPTTIETTPQLEDQIDPNIASISATQEEQETSTTEDTTRTKESKKEIDIMTKFENKENFVTELEVEDESAPFDPVTHHDANVEESTDNNADEEKDSKEVHEVRKEEMNLSDVAEMKECDQDIFTNDAKVSSQKLSVKEKIQNICETNQKPDDTNTPHSTECDLSFNLSSSDEGTPRNNCKTEKDMTEVVNSESKEKEDKKDTEVEDIKTTAEKMLKNIDDSLSTKEQITSSVRNSTVDKIDSSPKNPVSLEEKKRPDENISTLNERKHFSFASTEIELKSNNENLTKCDMDDDYDDDDDDESSVGQKHVKQSELFKLISETKARLARSQEECQTRGKEMKKILHDLASSPAETPTSYNVMVTAMNTTTKSKPQQQVVKKVASATVVSSGTGFKQESKVEKPLDIKNKKPFTTANNVLNEEPEVKSYVTKVNQKKIGTPINRVTSNEPEAVIDNLIARVRNSVSKENELKKSIATSIDYSVNRKPSSTSINSDRFGNGSKSRILPEHVDDETEQVNYKPSASNKCPDYTRYRSSSYREEVLERLRKTREKYNSTITKVSSISTQRHGTPERRASPMRRIEKDLKIEGTSTKTSYTTSAASPLARPSPAHNNNDNTPRNDNRKRENAVHFCSSIPPNNVNASITRNNSDDNESLTSASTLKSTSTQVLRQLASETAQRLTSESADTNMRSLLCEDDKERNERMAHLIGKLSKGKLSTK